MLSILRSATTGLALHRFNERLDLLKRPDKLDPMNPPVATDSFLVRRHVAFGVSLGLLIAWGAFLRLWDLSGRPFWNDEAWVANTATLLSAGEIFRNTETPVPPLFALTVKAANRVFSPPEVGLRLFPALCGIAALPLAFVAIRTLRGPRTIALVGVGLCASSPMLIIWSRELKQYSVEAFFSVLLATLVFRLRRTGVERKRWQLVSAVVFVCAVGPWFGYSFVFPAASLLGILIVLPPRTGSRRSQMALGTVGLIVLMGSVFVLLKLVAGAQSSDEALIRFMRPWFIDMGNSRSWLRAGSYAAMSSSMLFLPYEWVTDHRWILPIATVIWLLALVGLVFWPRTGRAEMACWVLIPWLLMIAAAVIHRYPFAVPRMMVFWALPMILASAAGLVQVFRACSIVLRGNGRAGMLFGLALPLIPAVYVVNIPLHHSYWIVHGFPDVLEELDRRRFKNEKVLVCVEAVPCVRYYAGGADETFVYPPTTAGTLTVPGYDYVELARRFIETAGPTWWLLAVNRSTDKVWKAVSEMSGTYGYELRLVAESGSPTIDGPAQLFQVTRVSNPPAR